MPQPVATDLHVNGLLTDISVAFIQDSKDFIAGVATPTVKVQKRSDIYAVYDQSDWMRDEMPVRADGTESAGIGYNVDNTNTYTTTRYSAHKLVTQGDKNNADTPYAPERDAVRFVTQKSLIKRERVWSAAFFTTSIWTTDQTGVAGVPTTNEFKQWNDASSTPIIDIRTQKTAILKLTGKMPNMMTFGIEVFDQLVDHPDFLDRIKHTQTGVVTEELIAQVLGLDRVVVAKAVHESAAEGATSSMAFVHGKSALLTYTTKSPGLYEPTAGYIFALTGGENQGAGDFGNRIRTVDLSHRDAGTTKVEIDLEFATKVIAADLGKFFATAVA